MSLRSRTFFRESGALKLPLTRCRRAIAIFTFYYKPQNEWRKLNNRPISKEDLAKIITTEIEALNPGARVMVAQPVEMRFNEMLEGIRADIAVKIFGNDYDVLERIGSEVKEVLEQIPGTREGEGEVEYETTGRAPMLEIRVKRDVLAKYNLHAGDVNQTIAAALGGQTVGTMIEQNRRFDIVVRLAEANRENLEAIRALASPRWRLRSPAARGSRRHPTCQNSVANFARFSSTPRGAYGQPAKPRHGTLGA